MENNNETNKWDELKQPIETFKKMKEDGINLGGKAIFFSSEKKYYQPSIEEFYVGLEFENLRYEQERNDHSWYSKDVVVAKKRYSYDDSDLASILKTYNDGETIDKNFKLTKYRVKFLDREDIEELGWKFDHDNFYDKGSHQMLITTEPFNVQIFDNEPYSGNRPRSERIFWGVLKNKSELRKLMQQLKIE